MNEPYLKELDAAEAEAWKNLARYKFWMFGYFAGRWVFLNRMLGAKRPNPFKPLVILARGLINDRAAEVRYQDAVTGANPKATKKLIEGLRATL